MSEKPYKDFKEKNEEYLKFKQQLEVAKTQIHNLGIALEQNKLVKQHLQLEMQRKGISDSEKASIKIKIAECDTRIKNVREEIIKQRKIPEKVNSMIDEVSRDPAIKQAVDKHLARGYARKLKHVQERKKKTESLLTLIEQHPAIKGSIRGMLESIKKIKELTKTLEKLDPSKEQDIIDATKSSIADNKKILDKSKAELETFLSKNNAEINIADIIKMTNKGYKLDGYGRIDVEKTLNRQINGFNKQIAHYTNAIQKTDPTLLQSGLGQTQVQSQDLPTEDIKPWQLIKRFKRWIANKKAERQAREEEDSYLEDESIPENNNSGSGQDLDETTVIEGRSGRQGRNQEQTQGENMQNSGQAQTGDTQSQENNQEQGQQQRQQKIHENIFKYEIVNDYVAQRDAEFRRQSRENRRNRNNSNDRDNER